MTRGRSDNRPKQQQIYHFSK